MKRKRLMLIIVCLAAVLLAGYVTLWLAAPKHRITWDNICDIKKGMTQEEVENVLGVPPGIYSSYPTGHYVFSDKLWGKLGPATGKDFIKKFGGKEWVRDGVSAYVLFDENGRAADIQGGLCLVGNESFLAKLRRWLGM